MKLLIVESPGKTKKLKAILGSEWNVSASVGHIRDLPKNGMGVEAPHFIPQYDITKEKVVSDLKELAKKADEIFLATDPDREGEAIAWHLQDALNLQNPKRVTYTSITEKDVLEGIAKSRTIDMNLVKAQEARRVLDRFCGYIVSNPLSYINGERLSAGRVQSPATRIIVEREKAIRAFISTTHFGVELLFNDFKATWKTENFKEDGQEYILDEALAGKIAQITNVTVVDFKEEEQKKAPPAPFTTSSLQQASSNALKFDPKKTMELAQKLYESGAITYMRTDSPNLSDEAINTIRDFANKQGLPLIEKPRTWKSKDGAQEAHEAIRPTYIENQEAGNSNDEKALYQLIRLRALGSQLKDAIYSVRSLKLKTLLNDKEVLFEARGNTLTFAGWKDIFKEDDALTDEESEESTENNIPVVNVGEELTATESKVVTKKTQAPTRYTLASLIRELEKKGIGRPATYASILDNIMEKGYIKEEKRKLHATSLGETLIACMQGYFQFLEYDFTKKMEESLDDIAQGKKDYLSVVSQNFDMLNHEVARLKKEKAIPCPKCQSYNLIRRFKKTVGDVKGYDFFACPDCDTTFQNNNGKPVEKQEVPLTNFECPKCQAKLKHIIGTNDKGSYDFFACSNNDCKTKFKNENGQPIEKKEVPLTDFSCEKCKSKLKHLKGTSAKGDYDFFCCSNDKCKTSYNNIDGKPVKSEPTNAGKKTQYKCKKCQKPLLEKPTKNGGIYFTCSNYPTCKERYWANEKGEPKFG